MVIVWLKWKRLCIDKNEMWQQKQTNKYTNAQVHEELQTWDVCSDEEAATSHEHKWLTSIMFSSVSALSDNEKLLWDLVFLHILEPDVIKLSKDFIFSDLMKHIWTSIFSILQHISATETKGLNIYKEQGRTTETILGESPLFQKSLIASCACLWFVQLVLSQRKWIHGSNTWV